MSFAKLARRRERAASVRAGLWAGQTLQREGRARLHLRRVTTVCEKRFFSSDSRRAEPNRYWARRRTRKLAGRRVRSSPQRIGLLEVHGHDHWARRPPDARAEHQRLPGGHPRVSEAAGGCAREGMAAERASGEGFACANAARTRGRAGCSAPLALVRCS